VVEIGVEQGETEMMLMTKEIQKKLPALYANDGKAPAEVRVFAKFFTPWTNWTWYATEYDPETRTFFGMVDGLEREFGYFTLDELQSIKGMFGLKIERDRFWDDYSTLADVQSGKAR